MEKSLKNYLIQKYEAFLSEDRKALINKVLANRTAYITLVLENIIDPHNANAIIRTGECLGIQHYHIIEIDNEFRVGKGVNKGATKWVDLHHYPKGSGATTEVFKELKAQGYKVVATSPREDAVDFRNLKLDSPIALVMGNERDGVSEDALNLADDYIKLPMNGFTESFNVSVAAGIALANLVERMRSSVENWAIPQDVQQSYRLDWYKKCMARPDDYEAFFIKAFEAEQES